MKNLEKNIGLFLLFFAIGFNLWLYRMEPTAKIDPNDNTFQYALVHRTNEVWGTAQLFDHWVPNWAQGYNLPYYYSHIPQIAIVASWRLLQEVLLQMSLYQYYHVVIYLLLCFFPLSVFFAIRVLGLSWLAAGFAALVSTQLSTDGLYGLDPASFVWRGYGLSSQLFAMIWLPLAIACSYRGKVVPAILFLTLTTAGHLGLGIIACMSIAVVAWHQWKKLLFIFGGMFLLLSYWIVPLLIHGNYHNISVWDPIWKFDSYGYRDVLKNLFNGDLFDFGRLPILTLFIFTGFFAAISFQLSAFSYLFIFWILLYFGRATWGSLVDIIPGMNEFHLSRFIVGVHLAGLFLIPISIESLKKNKLLGVGIAVIVVLLGVFPQTVSYSRHNDFLIARANEDFEKNKDDTEELLSAISYQLSENPGRVFAGRGGSWGKQLKIAETPLYMHLSTFGIPTILWLPQTWSPNSDTEQYFREDKQGDYDLYNVRYVVTPPNIDPQPFWTLYKTGKTWILYTVDTEGPLTTGIHPAIVSVDKTNYKNVVRLWIQSDTPKQKLFPELTFDTNYPVSTGLPNFRMIDEANYVIPDGSRHNLFSEVPRYVSSLSNLSTLSDLKITDSTYKVTVTVKDPCPECLVILKQTYHPSWQVSVDGERVPTFSVFPFYTAVKLEEPGKHEVVFAYKPSFLKKLLLLLPYGILLLVWILKLYQKRYKTKNKISKN